MRLSDVEFDSQIHVDDCDCTVEQADPRCLLYRSEKERIRRMREEDAETGRKVTGRNDAG